MQYQIQTLRISIKHSSKPINALVHHFPFGWSFTKSTIHGKTIFERYNAIFIIQIYKCARNIMTGNGNQQWSYGPQCFLYSSRCINCHGRWWCLVKFLVSLPQKLSTERNHFCWRIGQFNIIFSLQSLLRRSRIASKAPSWLLCMSHCKCHKTRAAFLVLILGSNISEAVRSMHIPTFVFYKALKLCFVVCTSKITVLHETFLWLNGLMFSLLQKTL